MQALVVDHSAPAGLRLGDAPDPVPGPGEALVEVRAISLNHGELRGVAGRGAGEVPGWDAAGVVRTPAADGSGPAAGARVVTFGAGGAWAQLRAVPTGELAEVPDGVDLGAAAALPVAGVTALRALRRLGPVLGLLAGGELDPQIGRRGPWGEVAAAAEELFARRISGKVVLDVA